MNRIGKLILKVIGGLLIVGLIVAGVGWWRLSEGPVKLGFLRGVIEDVVGSSMDNANLTIEDAVIERDTDNKAIRFRLKGLVIRDDKENFVARAPSAEIGLNISQLLTGSVKLTSLTLIGPRFTLHRKLDGSVNLGFEEEEKTSQAQNNNADKPAAAEQIIKEAGKGDERDVFATIISSLTNPAEAGGATSKLKSITIRDAKISFYDEALDAVFYLPKAAMVFRRGEKGLVLLANGQVAGGEAPGRMKLEVIFDEKSGFVDVLALISDVVPTALSDNMRRVNAVARVEMPLNGRANFRFNREGKLLNASAALDGGAGYVKFPSIMVEPLLVDEGEFRIVYDVQQNQIRIEDSVIFVGGVEARLAGLITPQHTQNGQVKGVSYRLSANSRKVEGGEAPEYMVENISLVGSVDFEDRLLVLDQFSLLAGDAKIDLAGTIRDGQEGTGINLNGKIKDMPVRLLQTLWPPAALQGAREWIVQNMKGGVASEAEIKIALTPEAIKAADQGLPIPQEQINIAFSYRDLEATYFGELPALYEARGYGLLTGNSFKLNMNTAKARVPSGKILNLSDGYFEISELNKHGPESIINLRLKGEAGAMLEVIDQKPLGYATQMGMSPKALGGRGAAQIMFSMPLLKDLPVERVQMNTNITIEKVALKDAIGDIDLTGGVLNLDVTMKGLRAHGDVYLNKAPAKLDWHESFDLSQKHTSRFKLTSNLTEKSRRLLGIDVSSFLVGPTPTQINGVGRGQNIARAVAKVNLDKARLFYEPLGWKRRPTKGTTASFNLGFPKKGEIEIKNLDAKGKGLRLTGGLRMRDDGTILNARLGRVHLGPITKLSLNGSRDKKNILQLKIKATAIDGKAIIDQLNAPEHPKTISKTPGSTIQINLNAAKAPAYNDHVLRNVRSNITLKSGRLIDMLLTGTFDDRSNLKIKVTPSGKRRRMILEGQNAGLILNAADLYGKVRGGTIIFKSWLSEPGQNSSGVLRMKDFIVSDKELNKIAHNSPKAELRPKKGELSFEKIKVPFKRTKNRIKIRDAILKGQSLGATANGSIDTGEDEINVKGSIIPAYGLNSFISHLPLVGQIITGGKGEGVIGINFSIRGPVKNATFKTDPLSALAPGILRKFLQGSTRDQKFDVDDKIFGND